ncbi:MAG: RNA methyltransferase [Planctomycetes bacterium]|nr:RNA methyltransferase [Planctomycetota bacterium]
MHQTLPEKRRYEFFVTCAPGLEPLLHQEIRELRFSKVERQVGGVRFEGTLRDAWRANLELRTAVRVLAKVARFEARDDTELYRGVQTIPWRTYLRPEGTLRVDAHSNESALEHTLFVEQRTKDAVCDQIREETGVRPSVDLDDAELGVYVHLFKDRCTLLVDTSGDSLHKRGWRRFQGRAPLAETLAAAVVIASEWDRRSPLVDPFCGSGTILIEAALAAANVAPGSFRARFGFERWPGHDAAAWTALRDKVRARRAFPNKLVLQGSDLDRAGIEGAKENSAAAGFEGKIEFECAASADFAPRSGWNAWLASNMPYGERIGDERDLMPIFESFGARLRERCVGWHLAILSGNPNLSGALGIDFARRIDLKNGSIDCQLLLTAL